MEEDATSVEGAGAVDSAMRNLETVSSLLSQQEFQVAAALGALVVVIDAMRRYDEIAFDARPNDVIYSIAPRFLSTSEDYNKSFALYVLLRLISYALPALAILFVFSESGIVEALGLPLPDVFSNVITHVNFPIFWGAVIAGVLPSFSFIRDVERAIRRLSQLAGGIPSGVKRVAKEIRGAALTPGANLSQAIFRTERFAFVDREDFDRGATLVDRKWARICYILDFFADQRARPTLADDFFERYASELEREETRFRSLQVRFAIHKVGYEEVKKVFSAAEMGMLPRTIAANDPSLEEDLDYLLDRLEIYLACALRFGQGNEEKAYEALRDMGFQVGAGAAAPRNPLGSIVVTFIALAVASIVGALAADYAVKALAAASDAVVYPQEVLPSAVPFENAVFLMNYTLIIVSSIIIGGFIFGTVLFNIPTNRIDARPLYDRPFIRYLFASVFGGFCGVIALGAMVVSPQALADGRDYAWILNYFPSFIVLALAIHTFAYGPYRGVPHLLGQAAMVGAVYAGVNYFGVIRAFTDIGLYAHLDEFEAATNLHSAALYYSILSFAIGLFASAALIYIFKVQRDSRLVAEEEIAHQRRSVRVDLENEPASA